MSTDVTDGARAPRGAAGGGIGGRPHVLRVGNVSGFYGDRFDALEEMLAGGELDVLTGDYLAELTMLILGRDRMKDPARGYAKTFLRQLERSLGAAQDRGVKIVANAGGLNPSGLAEEIRELGERLGIGVRVAHVEGDDLLGRGWSDGVLTANAYLGGAGITECLRAGADVVVTGRVTDAALVSGAASAHFGWGQDDWDALAGAVTLGHVLECGAQATGGNYPFFAREGIDVRRPGFPIAEVGSDGSGVITKHPGTQGAVTVGTVTAQLLYETGGARYPGPDVTTRLDTVRLWQEDTDRVRVEGVTGEAPPETIKVGLTRLGGFRNEVSFVLTGLDVEEKAELVRGQMEDALTRSGSRPKEVRWSLARTDGPDAPVQEEASALLRMVVRDGDRKTAGRAVSSAAIELALASYPGFHVTAPPADASPYGVFESAFIDASEVPHTAVLPDGRQVRVPRPPERRLLEAVPEPELPEPLGDPEAAKTRREPLGTVAGARSGDKGGNANIGVWARDGREDIWRWLVHELTTDRLRQLLPETERLPVSRYVLPNLRAVNFVIEGILGDGVAAQERFDPQAKGLGEWLRCRRLEIPEALLD